MTQQSQFHEGELAMQLLAGEQQIAERTSRMIGSQIPANTWQFLATQTMLWFATVDHADLPWANVLFGPPGFISAIDGTMLDIQLGKSVTMPTVWYDDLRVGKHIGCLAIEFSSRRRLRINGVIHAIDSQRLLIKVQQAYPNCPKYINVRDVAVQAASTEMELLASGMKLDTATTDLIARADTAIVASIGPTGADISHRGGVTGFVKVRSPQLLTVPDYKGNSMFNTLGNFTLNPVGGLTIIDFEQNELVQLAGTIEIFSAIELADSPTGGTQRYWQLTLQQWRRYCYKGLQSSLKST